MKERAIDNEEIDEIEEGEEEEVIPEPTIVLDPSLSREERYFQLLDNALQASMGYKPKFGKGKKGGVTLAEFQEMYGEDPFYHWVGIDSPLMYAAHKAAGGMTSIYRQLGIGGEWIFRAMLQESLGLSREQVSWSYEIPKPNGKTKTLKLDGRIQFEDIVDAALYQRILEWANAVRAKLLLPTDKRYKGVVFEVRQGYKSMDSKRQNADIDNATNAYIYDYIPVLLVLSKQIDTTPITRYTSSRLLILTGIHDGPTTSSTYSFCRNIIGYDLAAFFESYSAKIKMKLEQVLRNLLEA